MGPWWSLSYFQTPLSDGLWPRNVSQINPSSLQLLLVRVLYPSNRTLGIEHFLKWMSSNIAFLSRPYIILHRLLLKEQKAISGWPWHTATVQYAASLQTGYKCSVNSRALATSSSYTDPSICHEHLRHIWQAITSGIWQRSLHQGLSVMVSLTSPTVTLSR